jgi:hypothetical protein
VGKVKDFAKSSAMALPSTLWDSAVKVGKAASTKGTAGQRLDAALKVSKDNADDVGTAAKTSAKAAKDAVEDLIDEATDDTPANGRGGA